MARFLLQFKINIMASQIVLLARDSSRATYQRSN